VTQEPEPAWRPWARVVELALTAADEPDWARAVPEPAPDRAPDAPLLDGVDVRLDARRVRRLVRDLLHEAERSGARRDEQTPKTRPRRLDALAAVQAAIAQDAAAAERVAEAAGLEVARLDTVAQLAAMPFLRACASQLRDRIPSDWMKGYCPVCGAWPALAELRGIERNRRLRCGRCASDWAIPVLRCPFCDEMHHGKLQSLLPEGNEQTRRVDTCDACKGYIKTFSTLQAMALRSLATLDLATVELDIVALERGYARPAAGGYPVSITIVRKTASAAPRAAAPAEE
jgi:FdhE protein